MKHEKRGRPRIDPSTRFPKKCAGCGELKMAEDYYRSHGSPLPRCKPCDKKHSVYRNRIRNYTGPDGKARLERRMAQLNKELRELRGIQKALYPKSVFSSVS